MGNKLAHSRTVIEGLHTDRGIKYEIRDNHPIAGDFGGATRESAIRQLEHVGGDVDATRFDDGRAAVHLKLCPGVKTQSAISLQDFDGVVVDSFRLHLPESLVLEGPHKEAVESVGRIVEGVEPPTHVEVSIPVPGEPHPGVPHVVFDPKDTQPRNLRFLPVPQLVEFLADLKHVADTLDQYSGTY